jgi:pyridoxal 5'-phosphate synthase pdxT subunit
MVAEECSATKKGGQDQIGGLDVKVLRNRYGRQTESFVGNLSLPFLDSPEDAQPSRPFRGVFIRAPVVEELLDAPPGKDPVEVLGVYKKPDAAAEDEGDTVAVRQGNVFGTSFHPELTDDTRIHVWWLKQVLAATRHENGSA